MLISVDNPEGSTAYHRLPHRQKRPMRQILPSRLRTVNQ
jgi:hypothetical protein